jgi:hypothetical protein
MHRNDHTSAEANDRSLPSQGRNLIFAVLLPVAFAAFNSWLFITAIQFRHAYPNWAYLWAVFSTAAVSWCVGRYLTPIWLRLCIFAGFVALLDLYIMVGSVCVNHHLDSGVAYMLFSTQVSLFMLWAVFGRQPWQWRLPLAVGLTALLILFSDGFVGRGYYARGRFEVMPPWATSLFERWGWNISNWENFEYWRVTMIATSATIALSFALLRMLGYQLRSPQQSPLTSNNTLSPQAIRFGTKHILLWMTVIGPVLLLFGSTTFNSKSVISVVPTAALTAIVSIIVIRILLSRARWFTVLAFLVAILIFDIVWAEFHNPYSPFRYLSADFNSPESPLTGEADHANTPSHIFLVDFNPPDPPPPPPKYSFAEALWITIRRHVQWFVSDYGYYGWRRLYWYGAILLSAMLLFLRAGGYRLARNGA